MKHIRIAIDGPSGARKEYPWPGALPPSWAMSMWIPVPFTAPSAAMCWSRELIRRMRRRSWQPCPQAKVEIRYGEDGLQHMLLNGTDVTERIRRPEVSGCASVVSAHPGVRAHLLEMQRQMAASDNVVMDGRDIGTVVLPDAEVKVFLTATAQERARRRTRELEQRGTPQSYETTLREIEERDWNDTHRPRRLCVRLRTQ